MTRGNDAYAIITGRTRALRETSDATDRDDAQWIPVAGGAAGEIWLVDVDMHTGVAYARELGRPLYVSELSPWQGQNGR